MNKEYGKLTNEVWEFYELLFTNGGEQRQGKNYTFADGSGANNHPGHDRLILDGYRLVVATEYDQTTHKLVAGSYSIIDDGTMRQDTIAMTPQEIATAATAKLQSLLGRLKTEADNRVAEHISPDEVPHWLGVSNRISRKHSLWAENAVINPPITAEEEELWHNLEIIQGLTEAVRTVAAGISQQLYQMPNADILALPADWASTHVLWP